MYSTRLTNQMRIKAVSGCGRQSEPLYYKVPVKPG
jgi:hypothetical protein